jgi:hypothetical protein
MNLVRAKGPGRFTVDDIAAAGVSRPSARELASTSA